MVSVLCGQCADGGGTLGCLKELSVTALRTTLTVTASGENKRRIQTNGAHGMSGLK